MKTIFYFGCIAVLAPLSACQKDHSIDADPAKVDIRITSPLPGAGYRRGDTVYFKGRVSYPGQMHGYELKLADSATGMILHDDARHIHADNFELAGYWVADASQSTTVTLSLVANIDHDGGQGRREFSFNVRP